MGYIGTPIDTRNQFQSLQGKRFNGDGSTTDFTLDVAPSSTLDIEVFVGNVRQDPNSAYTLSGTTLSFTGAPPSGTNNIYVVHQAKSVGTIDVPADAVKADNLNSAVLTGQTDIGGAIADADLFLVDDGAGGTLRKTAASRIKTYVGSVGGATGLDVNDNVKVRLGTGNDTELFFDGTNSVIDHTSGSGTLKLQGDQVIISDSASSPANHIQIDSGAGTVFNQDGVAAMDFRVESDSRTEAWFVDSGNNNLMSGTTDTAGTLSGASSSESAFSYEIPNFLCLARNNNPCLRLNRTGGDGDIMTFASQGGIEGTISISGSTTSYGSFCGTHWSRLEDNSKPTILRGTVLESIAKMCEWYQVEFSVPKKDSETKQQKKDDDGNLLFTTVRKSIDLPNGGKVGDDFKYTHYGVEYTGKIIKENNEQLPMCKVSNTEDSKGVYGVFMSWDDDDDGTTGVNDMYVASLGEFMVRIHKDETVAIGDYLQSKGDGTAKKQADDILRASTIAKVTSTEKTHEYADGSYCVPCTLHCG